MKIQSSSVKMKSNHHYEQKTEEYEKLLYWNRNRQLQFGRKGVELTISDAARKLYENTKNQGSTELCILPVEQEKDFLLEISDKDKYKIALLESMLQALTGRKVKIMVPDKIKLDKASGKRLALLKYHLETQKAQGQNRPMQGWGLEYDYHKSYHETELTSFKAEGIVRTSDGREIQLSVSLNMARSFASSTDISVRAGDALLKDPLVINFDGTAAQLTDTKFQFDLDADGLPDQISFVNPHSGFLTLDRNNDGIINDGTELFGVKTGNGFDELRKLDSDSNEWIDENDPVFDKLRIWIKAETGKDKLIALGEKGVGAIYLGNVETPFNLNSMDNETNGLVRNTGIYLKENGAPGTLQQIDLYVG